MADFRLPISSNETKTVYTLTVPMYAFAWPVSFVINLDAIADRFSDTTIGAKCYTSTGPWPLWNQNNNGNFNVGMLLQGANPLATNPPGDFIIGPYYIADLNNQSLTLELYDAVWTEPAGDWDYSRKVYELEIKIIQTPSVDINISEVADNYVVTFKSNKPPIKLKYYAAALLGILPETRRQYEWDFSPDHQAFRIKNSWPASVELGACHNEYLSAMRLTTTPVSAIQGVPGIPYAKWDDAPDSEFLLSDDGVTTHTLNISKNALYNIPQWIKVSSTIDEISTTTGPVYEGELPVDVTFTAATGCFKVFPVVGNIPVEALTLGVQKSGTFTATTPMCPSGAIDNERNEKKSLTYSLNVTEAGTYSLAVTGTQTGIAYSDPVISVQCPTSGYTQSQWGSSAGGFINYTKTFSLDPGLYYISLTGTGWGDRGTQNLTVSKV